MSRHLEQSRVPKTKEHLSRSIGAMFAHEIYIHKAVGKGLARVFFREFEEREKAGAGGDVEFRFNDIVYFFAVAAASGVIGNLAYDALKHALAVVRKPRLEHGAASFSSVVRRRTYERLREKKYPKDKPVNDSAEVMSELEREYDLIVAITFKWRKKENMRAVHHKPSSK